MSGSTEQNQTVLVIGGGIAGLTAAWELSRLGVGVTLVEKGPFIGGHAAFLTCKATDRCLKCNDCLVEERLKAVSDERPFEICRGTEIVGMEKADDRFLLALRSAPQYIDPDTCTDCGACFEACPAVENGAVIRAPSHHIHPFYAIDPARCDCRRESEPSPCQSQCPENAIHLDRKGQSFSLEADGLILATGYTPFDPDTAKRYNFSRFQNMITGLEMEQMLREQGRVRRPSDGMVPGRVAFVQCVGSRDARLNHQFCSRVCCGYALRMALKLVHDDPDKDVTVFFMDIQNFGKDFHRYYEEAQTKLRLLRGLPGDFYGSEADGISLSYYEDDMGKVVTEDFDLVVLSVGIMPGDSNGRFQDLLGIAPDEDGFLTVSGPMAEQGIFTAGTVEGPMDVSESISHAKRAALDMKTHLRKKAKTP